MLETRAPGGPELRAFAYLIVLHTYVHPYLSRDCADRNQAPVVVPPFGVIDAGSNYGAFYLSLHSSILPG